MNELHVVVAIHHRAIVCLTKFHNTLTLMINFTTIHTTTTSTSATGGYMLKRQGIPQRLPRILRVNKNQYSTQLELSSLRRVLCHARHAVTSDNASPPFYTRDIAPR